MCSSWSQESALQISKHWGHEYSLDHYIANQAFKTANLIRQGHLLGF